MQNKCLSIYLLKDTLCACVWVFFYLFLFFLRKIGHEAVTKLKQVRDPFLGYFNNLHPISHLPFISKILENVLPPNSTSTSRITACMKISVQFLSSPQHRDSSRQDHKRPPRGSGLRLISICIRLDLSATCDKISHPILLNRLFTIGITHNPHC